MIVRNWHGRVPAPLADRYLALMREIALPDYKSTPGNLGAWCLTRPEGEIVHFEMLTFWSDLEAIKRFAGPDFEHAKYYNFDAEFLLEQESFVRHYEAVSE
ncbi:MAG: antibiotic biosynthesis monooxygenase [Caulobacter sp.]|nr:antibiotic biosynthesis monooxygenase [Caulobacter sp.]